MVQLLVVRVGVIRDFSGVVEGKHITMMGCNGMIQRGVVGTGAF